MNTRFNKLKNINRVVIKVGTSTLTHANGRLNLESMEKLVRQIADIHNKGIEVVLISSGAIGAGIGKLGLKEKPKTIPEKQAAAAVGQGILMHMYEKLFSEYGQISAQILLTKEDMNHRMRFLNARNTFFSLLSQNVIPIVNENDAIVVDEIKFGDNDTLSAIVSSVVDADLLIILSDIDGLYDKNPKIHEDAKLIKYIEDITPEIENSAGGAGSSLGTGGMITKIKAAKIATCAGTSMIIVNGSTNNIIRDILNFKDVGTFFECSKHPLQCRKHWLAFNADIKGDIIIDNGAKNALIKSHKSLLPSGIVSINGDFIEGEIVNILDSNNNILGRGITNYNSSDVEKIKGANSSEIKIKLGHKNYDEIIHANNLVII